MTRKLFLYLSFTTLILTACDNTPLDIDCSSTNVNIQNYNMDSIFVNANVDELTIWNERFKNKIQDAYYYELGQCLRIKSADDSLILNSVQTFIKDPYIQSIEKAIAVKHKNSSKYHTDIVEGMRHLKFHFPQMKIPKATVFVNSCFQSSAFCTENEIVIGLERYLGKDEPLLKKLPSDVFYEWIKKGMEPQFLTRDAICGWILTQFEQKEDANLAESMVNWGKVLYSVEAAFPDEKKEIIVRYTAEELKWAEENEKAFWSYLINEKLLFVFNQREKNNMLRPGPTTIGLPKAGGPDRLGQYLGWQMVRNYMKENDITLAQLQTVPYSKILQAYEID